MRLFSFAAGGSPPGHEGADTVDELAVALFLPADEATDALLSTDAPAEG